jgi:hypothetical protein
MNGKSRTKQELNFQRNEIMAGLAGRKGTGNV